MTENIERVTMRGPGSEVSLLLDHQDMLYPNLVIWSQAGELPQGLQGFIPEDEYVSYTG